MNTLKQKSIILILVESSILSMTCVIYSNKYQKHTIVRFPVSNGKPYSFRTVSYHWFCFVSFFPFYCYFSLLFFLFFFFLLYIFLCRRFLRDGLSDFRQIFSMDLHVLSSEVSTSFSFCKNYFRFRFRCVML